MPPPKNLLSLDMVKCTRGYLLVSDGRALDQNTQLSNAAPLAAEQAYA